MTVVTPAASRSIRLTVLVAAVFLVAGTGAPASASTKVTGTALALLDDLSTASEHPAGYKRTLFKHWVDADEDGCSTRAEVLIEEAQGTAVIGDDCAVTGSWRSAYDGVVTTVPGSFDIDHVVPLKEAWDSGAWAWAPGLRERYANDLGDWRSLRAVTATTNRSKADQDPADWLPPRLSFRCTYVRDWIAVKVRWNLRVDSTERAAIETVLGFCATKTMTVTVLSTATPPTPSPPASPNPTPAASPSPTPTVTPIPSLTPTPPP